MNGKKGKREEATFLGVPLVKGGRKEEREGEKERKRRKMRGVEAGAPSRMIVPKT